MFSVKAVVIDNHNLSIIYRNGEVIIIIIYVVRLCKKRKQNFKVGGKYL